MPPLVSVISCALNQGDWVRKTIPLIRESLGDWSHEIIIVDDQSTDGCCHGLDKDVLIIRTENRFGVSASRRLAVSNASGDVYLFTDPHCNYGAKDEHSLRDLIQVACDKQAICLPRTTGLPKVSKARYGGYLTKSDRGLKVSYALRRPADWPALLGTIYAIQRPVYEHLGGWPELPGVWGYSEQALSLMAWFSGVPIYVDSRHICNHQHYHPNDRFSYRVPMTDQANNGHWVHAAFFPKSYEDFWAPTLKARFRAKPEYWKCLTTGFYPKAGLQRLQTIDKFRYEIACRAVRSEEDFFTLILGMEMPRPSAPSVDEALIAQQRKRSKPRSYGEIQRRQSRAIDWFIGQVPGCIKGRKILDLGSRDGFVVAKLNEMGAKATGIELVPETAQYAKETLKRNVVAGDMRNLPDKDGSWHMVTCIHSLEHVPDPENAMKELLRVLMPGGWFLVVVPVEEVAEKRSGHNCAFATEEQLKELVEKFPVENIVTTIKGLAPKPKREILLCGRKQRGKVS